MSGLVETGNAFFDNATNRLLNSNWDGTRESARCILQIDGGVLDSVILTAVSIYGKKMCEQVCSLDEE